MVPRPSFAADLDAGDTDRFEFAATLDATYVNRVAPAEIRQHIETTHDYVGDSFASEARAMYYGEAEHRPVWGEVTPDEAKYLIEEGVPALPLPKPFAPEPPRRRAKLN